jgi:hypothetical protein
MKPIPFYTKRPPPPKPTGSAAKLGIKAKSKAHWVAETAKRLEQGAAKARAAVGLPSWRTDERAAESGAAAASSGTDAPQAARAMPPMVELGHLRLAGLLNTGFSPARHAVMVEGRPVQVSCGCGVRTWHDLDAIVCAFDRADLSLIG